MHAYLVKLQIERALRCWRETWTIQSRHILRRFPRVCVFLCFCVDVLTPLSTQSKYDPDETLRARRTSTIDSGDKRLCIKEKKLKRTRLTSIETKKKQYGGSNHENTTNAIVDRFYVKIIAFIFVQQL